MRMLATFFWLGWFAVSPLQAELTGTLRIAGNPELDSRVAHWAAAFQRQHPGLKVETHLTGSDTAMAALYTGKADLALLGRTPTLIEIQAFEWIHRYKPAQMEILTGSLDHPGRSPALSVLVHPDNPIRGLTLAQLEAVFGTEHRRSATNIRTWGQLGLTGEWADHAISLYGPDAMSGTGRFFRHEILGDSRMMNWEALREFSESENSATPHDAGKQIRDALAKDRFGMAVAPLDSSDDRVRPLPLAADAKAQPIELSSATLISREYPLTRAVIACFNRPIGGPPDPVVREFLTFVLSAEGQEDAGDGYLPLSAEDAARQLSKLE